MIPDKIEKAYFTIAEASRIIGTSRWKLEQIIEAMRSNNLIKVCRSRNGSIRLTQNHIEKIRLKAENYRSII